MKIPALVADQIRATVANDDAYYRMLALFAVHARDPENTFVADRSGTIVYIGSLWESLTGRTPADTVGRPLLDFVCPEDRVRIAERFEDAMADREIPPAISLDVQNADESCHSIEVTAEVVADHNGFVVGLFGTIASIEEQHRAEIEFPADPRFVSAVLDHVPVAICVTSLEDGVLVWANRAFELLSGFSRRDAAARSIRLPDTLIHPDDVERRRSAIADFEADSDGRLFVGEYRIRRPNDSLRWISLRELVFRRNPNGTPTQKICIAEDVTNRRRAQDALRESEEKYRLIAENTADGLAIIDGPTLTVTYASPTYDRLYGRPIGGSVGRGIDHTSQSIHPDDWESLSRQFQDATSQQHPELSYEYRALHSDGSYRWLANSMRFVYEKDGSLARAHVVARDVTNEKMADQELNRTLEQLETAVRDKSNLMREMNHRVKNNLLSLSSMLSLAATHAESRQAADALEQSRLRVAAMSDIHEMLNQDDAETTVQFDSFVGRIVDRFTVMYARGSVHIEHDTESIEVPLRKAVPVGLVFNELLTNACKHGRRKGKPLTVHATLRRADGRFELTVDDDGPGLPAEFAPDQASSLGMTLIRAMVDQVRGTISIESKPEHGVGVRATVRWKE